jgi:hypothetical protein
MDTLMNQCFEKKHELEPEYSTLKEIFYSNGMFIYTLIFRSYVEC